MQIEIVVQNKDIHVHTVTSVTYTRAVYRANMEQWDKVQLGTLAKGTSDAHAITNQKYFIYLSK